MTKDDFKKAGYNESGVIFQDKELAQLRDLVTDLRLQSADQHKASSEAMKAISSIDKALQKMAKVNIGSLFQVLSRVTTSDLPNSVDKTWLSKNGYAGNGTIGMSERGAIDAIIKVVKQENSPLSQELLSKIGEYYSRGLTTVDLRNDQDTLSVLRNSEDVTIGNIVDYLADVTDGRYSKKALSEVFNGSMD